MALSNVKMRCKKPAYKSLLGYYSTHEKFGKVKEKFGELANEFSRCMGLDSPPAVSRLLLSKLGLENVPGLCSK
jgi:hypothetical protein